MSLYVPSSPIVRKVFGQNYFVCRRNVVEHVEKDITFFGFVWEEFIVYANSISVANMWLFWHVIKITAKGCEMTFVRLRLYYGVSIYSITMSFVGHNFVVRYIFIALTFLSIVKTVNLYLLDNYCIRICKERVKILLLTALGFTAAYLSLITMRFTEKVITDFVLVDIMWCRSLFFRYVDSWLPSTNSYVIWVGFQSYLRVQVSYKFYIFPIRFFNFWQEEHLESCLSFLVQCVPFDFVASFYLVTIVRLCQIYSVYWSFQYFSLYLRFSKIISS